MRVMVIVKADPNDEANYTGSEEEFAAMGRYNEELVEAGVMLAGEGLAPSSKGKRVEFSGESRRVVDGPFTESKEVIAGFWIWQVKSMDEAVEWARRCPNTRPEIESHLELRPIMEMEDFGEEFTPELREQEARLREATEKRAGR